MLKKLAIFCGASLGDKPAFEEKTRELIRLLSHRNVNIIYGGGNTGIMGIVAEEAQKNNIPILGVVPSFLLPHGVVHERIPLHVVHTMQERKQFILDEANAFIILPGGIGTMDEFFEVLTAVQLGSHLKPIGILNVEQFFDPLIHLLHHLKEHRFVRMEHLNVSISEDPSTLIESLEKISLHSDTQWIQDLLKHNTL